MQEPGFICLPSYACKESPGPSLSHQHFFSFIFVFHCLSFVLVPAVLHRQHQQPCLEERREAELRPLPLNTPPRMNRAGGKACPL